MEGKTHCNEQWVYKQRNGGQMEGNVITILSNLSETIFERVCASFKKQNGKNGKDAEFFQE